MPRLVSGLLVIIGAVACSAPVEDAEPPAVDRCLFERDVYPVLARDCGFPACHGSSDRFFQVWAPGRTRLDPASGPLGAPTEDELAMSFDRTRAMLAMAAEPEQSLLLRKPLEQTAGGAAHMGTDALGRNVYADRSAPGWQTLAAWAHGEEAACP